MCIRDSRWSGSKKYDQNFENGENPPNITQKCVVTNLTPNITFSVKFV